MSFLGYFFTLFALFGANENLTEKSSSVTFESLWSPNFIKKIRKNKWHNFEKLTKKSIFRPFWALFVLFWANENLPEKSSSVTFECLWSLNFIKKKQKKLITQFWDINEMSLFSYYGSLISCKKSEKTNESIQRKVRYRRTDARTDGRIELNS